MRKLTPDRLIFQTFAYIAIITAAILCVLPFVMVISGSISSQTDIIRYGYRLIPQSISFDAYVVAFNKPEALIRAYGVTTLTTLLGTCIGLFITSMAAYVLSRKDFEYRNLFSFFFYFTTLFSGGLVPWYILCSKYLKLTDTFLALLLPFMLNVFNLLIMKSFMTSIPSAISESAKLDGANDFRIFVQLILPLSKPALASIGLFIALGYWNDFFTSFMFIQNQKLFSLQYYLYKIVVGAQALARIGSISGRSGSPMPTETLKLALTLITTGPIFLLYPLVQRFFVSGLTIGAVKG